MNFKQTSVGLGALLLAACASTPAPNQLLNDAESSYQAAKATSGILNSSAREMDAAKEALDKAQRMHEAGNDKNMVDHYATVALKNAEIAKERRELRRIRQEIEQASDQRQRMLVEARASEAERAEVALESAKAEALQMAAQMDELKAEQSKRGLVLTLQDIVFGFNSAELQPGGERTVNRIAEYLNEYPKRKLTVEGFTDSVGSEEYNLRLSEKRADAIKQALIGQGVERDRINTKGLGESYPVAPNDSDAGRQQNRRVEVIVSNQDDTDVSDR